MTQTRDNSNDLRFALTSELLYSENELVNYTENFTVLKGQERLYTRAIIYMENLDLSYNSLNSGEVSALVALKNVTL
jgi:hypothetical protein